MIPVLFPNDSHLKSFEV